MPTIKFKLEDRIEINCKILGFHRFRNGGICDYIALTDDFKKIRIDPFVSCAIDYKDKNKYLEKWVKVFGYFHTIVNPLTKEKDTSFIVYEGLFLLRDRKTIITRIIDFFNIKRPAACIDKYGE